MSLHNQLMLGGVRSLACHVAYLHELSFVSSSIFCSRQSSEEWHNAVHQDKCCLYHEHLVCGYLLPRAERKQTAAKKLA